MKAKINHRSLSLETWRADQWELPIQTKVIASTTALHTIKPVRLSSLLEEPGLWKPAAAPRFRSHRRYDLSRLLRRLMVRQMVAAGGAL